MEKKLVIFRLCIMLVVLGVIEVAWFGFHRGHSSLSTVSAATSDVPAGLTPGTKFWISVIASDPEQFEVLEVQGSWVHAKIIKARYWNAPTVIWVNLAATQKVTF
jgi:hypothetical protein